MFRCKPFLLCFTISLFILCSAVKAQTLIEGSAFDHQIPDNTGGWVSSDILVSSAPANAQITGVTIYYEVTHPNPSQLDVWVTFEDPVGSWHDNYLYSVGEASSNANLIETRSNLSSWNGYSPNQNWYLSVMDRVTGVTGYINYYEVRISYEVPNQPPIEPYSPIPINNVSNVPINIAELDWRCSDPDGDAITYTVYFEKDDPSPDEFIKVGTGSGANLDYLLDYNSHYYWTIRADDGRGGITWGPTWNFLTEDAPNQSPTISISSPSNTTYTQGDLINICWSGTDPNNSAGVTLAINSSCDFNNITTGQIIPNQSVSGCYSYNTNNLSPGNYYIIAAIGDGISTSTDCFGAITIDPKPTNPSVTLINQNYDMQILQNESVTIEWTSQNLEPSDEISIIIYDSSNCFYYANEYANNTKNKINSTAAGADDYIEIGTGLSAEGNVIFNLNNYQSGNYYLQLVVKRNGSLLLESKSEPIHIKLLPTQINSVNWDDSFESMVNGQLGDWYLLYPIISNIAIDNNVYRYGNSSLRIDPIGIETYCIGYSMCRSIGEFVGKEISFSYLGNIFVTVSENLFVNYFEEPTFVELIYGEQNGVIIGFEEIPLDNNTWHDVKITIKTPIIDNQGVTKVEMVYEIDGVKIGSSFIMSEYSDNFSNYYLTMFPSPSLYDSDGIPTSSTWIDEVSVKSITAPEPEVINYGTTVIVHGLALLGGDSDGFDDEQKWVLPMSEAIINRLGKGRIFRIEGGLISQYNQANYTSNFNDPTGEQVINFSWIPESNESVFGYAEGAADALFAILIQGANEGNWSLDQLHFIAHSRGAVVASETIQRLGLFSESGKINNHTIDGNIHFTTLDPHPWDDDYGDCLADPLSAKDNEVNDGINELNGEIGAGVINWANVGYADNYWQGTCIADNNDLTLNGLRYFPGIASSTPLDQRLENFLSINEHSMVHAWYYGSIILNCDLNSNNCSDGNDITIKVNWYDGLNREDVGFNLTRNFINKDITSLKVDNSITLQSDNNVNIHKIFNGDFSMVSLSGNKPGWSFQGGADNSSNDLIQKRLVLNSNHQNATHNFMFIPSNASAITFDLGVIVSDFCHDYEGTCTEYNSNQLELLINEEVIASFSLYSLYCNIKSLKSSSIYIYAGQSAKITFRLVDYDEGLNGLIESEVWVDNVEFDLDVHPEFYASTCSPVDLIVTDENDNFVSKDSSTIGNTYYEVYSVDETDTIAVVKIRDPQLNSIYNVDVIPWDGTNPNEIYSLYVNFGEEEIMLADQETISNIPPNGYLISTIDTGSIQGFVVQAGIGSLGVPVDLFDEAGELVGLVYTDENGVYEFPSLNNGIYTVSISPPLGFTSESEVQEIIVRGLPHEVNFELIEGSSDKLHHIWWWKIYLDDLRKDGPRVDEFTKDDVNLWLQRVFDHYYSRIDNYAIQIENTTYKGIPAQPLTFDDLVVGLVDIHEGTYESYVRKNLLINLLNIASGKMLQTKVVTADSATVSQAITYFYQVYEANKNNNNFEERNKLIVAYQNLRKIFMGQMISAGIVPLTTPNVMYKDADDGNELELLPTEFSLSQNYPNPFNPTTEISFSLPEVSDVKLEVYNLIGQKVTTVFEGSLEAGIHSFRWDGTTSASGVYLYKLTAGDFVETKKMVLLK